MSALADYKRPHRPPGHMWHLIRCRECEQLLINAAPHCPHCGTRQAGVRTVQVVIGTALALMAVLGFLLAADAYFRSVKQAEEKRAETLLWLQQARGDEQAGRHR